MNFVKFLLKEFQAQSRANFVPILKIGTYDSFDEDGFNGIENDPRGSNPWE